MHSIGQRRPPRGRDPDLHRHDSRACRRFQDRAHVRHDLAHLAVRRGRADRQLDLGPRRPATADQDAGVPRRRGARRRRTPADRHGDLPRLPGLAQPVAPGGARHLKMTGGKIGAGEGIRTLDPDLGKVVLYP